MAKILVVSMPFAGHVGAMTAVTAELIARGHELVAYTGAKYHSRFTSLGATWLPWTKATDFDDADLAATFPKIGDGKGLRGTQANGEYVVFGTAAGQIADILAAGPYDLLVTDQIAFGGAIAGQALGIPWATVCVTPLSLTSGDLPPTGMPWPPATNAAGRARDAAARWLTGRGYRVMTDPKLNRLRADAGLGPVAPGRFFDSVYSTDLVLAQGVQGLDYTRTDLPPQVHFVGRLTLPPATLSAPELPATPPAPEPSATSPASGLPASDLSSSGSPESVGSGDAGLPEWWSDLDQAKAVVHVTQGTVDMDLTDLMKPALAGLADQDVLVVCTTGGADPAVLGPLPANARAAAFIPHDQLLPRVDVMITNGGWGGVLAAVQSGVPLIVAGASLDKPEVARRVAWSGVGVNLRTGQPAPGRVSAAVNQVLSDRSFRERAREIGARITAAGGPQRAVDLLEQLLDR